MILSKNRISKSEINDLPLTEFKGDIFLIDTQEKAQKAYNELSSYKEVGVDTETRPAFNKGEFHPVSLVQFSTLNKAYIFQLKYCGFKEVKILFESSKIAKIGLGLRDDLKDLKKYYEVFEARNVIDIGKIATRKGIIQAGVRTLSARYLEKRISKSMQVSNWAKKDLSTKQLRYAATDAWICLEIYPKLIHDKTDYHKLKIDEDKLMDTDRVKKRSNN